LDGDFLLTSLPYLHDGKNHLMRKIFLAIILTSGISGLAQTETPAQNNNNRWNRIDTSGLVSMDSVTRGPYTLVFVNKEPGFDIRTKQRLIETFFKVYPQQVKRFNPNSLKRVVFFIDPAYQGVAAAGGGIVRYNPTWFQTHPDDIDVVTHEVMHIVQSYGRGAGPGWLTEGIADYVREKYGVDNATGKWALPKYDTSHAYTKSYRITARFLLWLEKKVRPTIVDELDAHLRAHTYKPETWQELTGKTLDELWKAYSASPNLD
jgi:hypothetical protein